MPPPANIRSERKGNPVSGGIAGPPCRWGVINTGAPSSRFGVRCKAAGIAPRKINIVANFKEMNPESCLTVTHKEALD
jgi:hypothetical protein